MPTIEQVRELMRQGDYHFACPKCNGAFFGTRRIGQPDEVGYCKTEFCDFEWLRTEDGDHFYTRTSVNDILRQAERIHEELRGDLCT